MEKIRRHLSSIYRQFLRTGNVEIIVNGQSLEAPDYGILYAPFYKTPDGENILWRKEIDFEMGEYKGEFYQFNLSSCIRQQNSLTAQFVSFSLSNLANIFYPPNFYNN